MAENRTPAGLIHRLGIAAPAETILSSLNYPVAAYRQTAALPRKTKDAASAEELLQPAQCHNPFGYLRLMDNDHRRMISSVREHRRNHRLVPRHYLQLVHPFVLNGSDVGSRRRHREPGPGGFSPTDRTGPSLHKHRIALKPALTSARVHAEKFEWETATVGAEKIHKPWKSPVVALLPHPRADARGLTPDEAKDLHGAGEADVQRGEAVPVSDVGLISTQEDVIRRPDAQPHAAVLQCGGPGLFLLVQRTVTDKDWALLLHRAGSDRRAALDYFAEVKPSGPKFEGTSCQGVMLSGPLAIHLGAQGSGTRRAQLAAAVSQHIAEQPRSVFAFPEDSPKPPTGELLRLKFCARCHSEDGDRAYALSGAVTPDPCDGGLRLHGAPATVVWTPEEIEQLKARLAQPRVHEILPVKGIHRHEFPRKI